MITKSVIKYIQSLQHKKFRDEHGAFIAEGIKTVNELLHGKYFECESIWCTEKVKELIKINGNAELNTIKDFELEKISALSTPSGVLAVFKQRPVADKIDFRGRLTPALDGIQDPGNLGTIIRIADWFGIKNIVCSHSTADCYNPKVVQSTMASLGRVNIIYKDLNTLLSNAPVKKYAAVLGGKDINETGKIKEGIIIIGNESKGISDELLKITDEKITIPKTGEAESLNAAVAAGIIIFALKS